MKKRFLTLALALLVCFSAAFMFAGCSGDPAHKATLTASATSVTFTLDDKDIYTKIDALTLTYKANGDVYYEFSDKDPKAYKDWAGKYSEAVADAQGAKAAVRTCTLNGGIDVATKTAAGETRRFTITINNASVSIEYTVA